MWDWQGSERVADAVLYEGYALYPYRPDAVKNRRRWTFGRVVPPVYAREQGGSDPWARETVCLLEAERPRIRLRLRCLELLDPEPGCGPAGWEPAWQREQSWSAPDGAGAWTWTWPAETVGDPAQGQGRTRGITAGLKVLTRAVGQGPRGVLHEVHVRLENRTPVPPGLPEADALHYSLLAAHLLLGAEEGRWISLQDPEPWAASRAAACPQDRGWWPVLAGSRRDGRIMLAAPIILYDYPQLAPESPGDLFDGLEIDELLTLRILTLTPAEQEAAKAADPRVRALLERTRGLPREVLYGLHGVTFRPPERGEG
ncbi:conserved protein of unknown function [Candidatus Hydrogenisulfobacillus filiaventi]|uniref:Uncharacterized protein n=1 Tax=Candidatus Hydrogenisulfobacillus filiaventi TaxID=2707344 RepID=A0A6F8ZIR1_9FIRM|nr:hypothetical protein [Bacillota bacterium]CAB1129769.1 conserved protein of unknown function [Candidatus Hydrogenisulfobacillus filiaventi]